MPIISRSMSAMVGRPHMPMVASSSSRSISRTDVRPFSPSTARPQNRGAAYQNGAGAEGEGLDDVGAAADASVHVDLDVSVGCLDDLGQDLDGGEGGVEVAGAVVGDDDGLGAVVGGGGVRPRRP